MAVGVGVVVAVVQLLFLMSARGRRRRRRRRREPALARPLAALVASKVVAHLRGGRRHLRVVVFLNFAPGRSYWVNKV